MIRTRLIGYTRVERRRDHRRPTELTVRIGDQSAKILDISLGGLRVAEFVARTISPETYKLGDIYRIQLDIPSYGLLELKAHVARVDTADQFVGLRFEELDSTTYRVIERLAIGRPVATLRP